MREAGDVCYADTYKDGTGMVEFLRYEDMKYAIKKLDDSRFRSHEVCCIKSCSITYFLNSSYVYREKYHMCALKKIAETVSLFKFCLKKLLTLNFSL